MGGTIYPESLIHIHTDFLHRSVLGDTHSIGNSSKLCLNRADKARAAVLSFFRAPSKYTVVFTTNATGTLKLIGESFPFSGGSTYILSADSHNSMHGIWEFATARRSRICYIPCLSHGGMDPALAKNILLHNHPRYKDISPRCNTVLDAAALVLTSVVSLEDTHIDTMAVSFYKMLGFPTGVGALVVKKSFLVQLKRPWFAGGIVGIVQVPGTIHGTLNYLTLPVLLHYVISSLTQLCHDTTGMPIVCEQANTGSIISLIFLSHAASQHKIFLCMGCMCNPGGTATILNIQDDMKQLYTGVTRQDFENIMGFGLASNFYDTWQVIHVAMLMSNEWTQETSGMMIGQAI
ncbi:pyridoxal phosphate-dependent transferase [Armillaria nabsnona]|nr:pyridoxal phosphate-dependent transferase [Armillaria nabsnona]